MQQILNFVIFNGNVNVCNQISCFMIHSFNQQLVLQCENHLLCNYNVKSTVG